jgi:hypothetical protein
MNIPITIGLPQIIVFIVVLIGIALLISFASKLIRGETKKSDEYEDFRKYGMRHRHHRFKAGRLVSGIILLLLAFSALWLTLLVQTYVGLTSDIEVAKVHATSIANAPHLMSLELTLYNQSGSQTSDKTYLVNGDEWMLEGDIIKFPTWLNIVGLHSGYKLTRLEGRYNDPQLELSGKRTVITLNGGDDNFFKTVQQQAWVSPIIQAAYGNAVFLTADGKTYDVYVSQTGLYAVPQK